MKTQHIKTMGYSESSAKEDICSYKCLHYKTRKISNQQTNFTTYRKKKNNNKLTQTSKRKEIIKIRAKVNKIENRQIVEKTNETKS